MSANVLQLKEVVFSTNLIKKRNYEIHIVEMEHIINKGKGFGEESNREYALPPKITNGYINITKIL